MKPRISILNPAFVWIPACAVDVSKTFERIRKEQAALAAAQPKAPVIEHPSVVNMKRPKV